MDSVDVQTPYGYHLATNRHLRLNFEPELETVYREATLPAALRMRAVAAGMLLCMYGLQPWVDRWLQPPAEFVATARLIQFGFAAPIVMLVLLTALVPRMARLSDVTVCSAIVAVSVSSMTQRLLGGEFDYHVAAGWANIAIMGGFFFSGLRFRQILPLNLVLLCLNLWTEYSIGGAPRGDNALINMAYEIQVALLMFIVGAAGAYLLEVNVRLNWLETQELALQSIHDGLTGLWTRGNFNAVYRRLFDLARREQRSITVAMVDIDHFKAYNDHYGHVAGDRCLRLVARALNRVCERHGGHCARLGGEEFAALFYGKPRSAVEPLLAELCTAVRDKDIAHRGSPDPSQRVSVSVGGCWLIPQPGMNRFEALRSADEGLYRAKSRGRDQVCATTAERHGNE